MTTTATSTLHPEFRKIDGLSIRIAESARHPKQAAQALLLSPWPESLYAYEPTWAKLAQHAHLVAVDLPGFGHSERRNALMSPRAMGDFIVRIADELGLQQPHVVAPDIGTSAALFAAAGHPERFRSIVIGSGGAVMPLQLGAPLKEWVEAPDLEPYRRIDGREVVDLAIGTLARYSLSNAAREDYRSGYAGERFAESMRYVREYPRELPMLRDLLPGIRTPVKVIAGRNDMVVPLANAQFLVDRLPHAELTVIDEGHFTWEDGADEYAAHVIAWWNSDHTATARTGS